MFSKAYAIATQFTRPIVISRCTYAGECTGGVGSLVPINDQGHFLTAFHILNSVLEMGKQMDAANQTRAEILRIEADKALTHKARKHALKSVGKINPKSTRASAVLWGDPSLSVASWRAIPQIDLALGKFTNWNPPSGVIYPEFKDPSKPLPNGTSLCKLGYPFVEVKPTYDDKTNTFELPPDTQFPVFPIDGILTRFIDLEGSTSQRPFPLRFIETSSPGLRGQSGGPIFDVQGTIWGIQSQTRHFPLGFDPPVPGGKPHEKEHQFLNVGWGVHCETIVGFLRAENVPFRLANY